MDRACLCLELLHYHGVKRKREEDTLIPSFATDQEFFDYLDDFRKKLSNSFIENKLRHIDVQWYITVKAYLPVKVPFIPPEYGFKSIRYWKGYAKELLDRKLTVNANNLPSELREETNSLVDVVAEPPLLQFLCGRWYMKIPEFPRDMTLLKLYSCPTYIACDRECQGSQEVFQSNKGIWCSTDPFWLPAYLNETVSMNCRLDITTTRDVIKDVYAYGVSHTTLDGDSVRYNHVQLHDSVNLYVVERKQIRKFLLNTDQDWRLGATYYNDMLECILCNAFLCPF